MSGLARRQELSSVTTNFWWLNFVKNELTSWQLEYKERAVGQWVGPLANDGSWVLSYLLKDRD